MVKNGGWIIGDNLQPGFWGSALHGIITEDLGFAPRHSPPGTLPVAAEVTPSVGSAVGIQPAGLAEHSRSH